MANMGEVISYAIEGTDGLSGPANAAASALEKLNSSGGNVALGAAKAAAGLLLLGGTAVVGALGVGVTGAGDLEQAVANISTIKPEINTAGVFSSLNEMSTRVPQTAAQLGESLYNVFSSVNVTQEQGIKLTEQFAQGAVGAGTDAATFGTAVMGVMNAYGLSVEDASKVSDVFFNTVNAGVVSGSQLAAGLGPVTASAKAAGVSIEEMGAMIVGVTKQGGEPAQNINNLNNLLQKITTEPAQKAMQGMGIATTTATGAFRPQIDVLTDLKARLGGMTESARANALQSIFPDAQARIGAQTIMDQLDSVNAALAQNTNSVGSAAAAFTTMNGTFNSQMQMMKNTFMSGLVAVGAMILPLITPWFATMSSAFTTGLAAVIVIATDAWGTLKSVFAGDWSPSETIDPVVNAIGMIGIVVRDQVMPVLVGFMGVISQVGAFLAQHTEIVIGFGAAFASLIAIGAGIAVFGAVAAAIAFMVSPIGLVVAAIGILTAAWVGNWGGIQEITAQAISWITATVSAGLAAITGFWDAHGAAITAAATTAWSFVTAAVEIAIAAVTGVIAAGMQLIEGDWSGAWTTITATASAVWTGWSALVAAAMALIMPVVAAAWARIQATISAALDAISAYITGVWTGITASIAAFGAAIWAGITETWTAGVASIQGVLDSIGTAISSAWTGFVSFVSEGMANVQTAIMSIWDLIPLDIRTDLILIATTLVAQGAAWLASVTTTAQAIWTSITTKFTEISTAITTWAADQMATFAAFSGTATTEATVMATGVWTSITTKFTEIATAITTWASEQLATLTALAGTATTAALAIGTGIWTSITTKIAEVATAIKEWAASAVMGPLNALIGTAGSAAASIGSAIISGIKGAIMSGAQSIASAAADVVRKALSAAKSAIGADSPSKLFRDEVGKPITQGIALGIDNGSSEVVSSINALMAMTTKAVDFGSLNPHADSRSSSIVDSSGYSSPSRAGASVGAGSSAASLVFNQTLAVQTTPDEMQRYTERALRKLATEWGTI